MALFHINGTPLKFDLVGLSDKAFKKIADLITDYGGEVEHNDKQPIKFTDKLKFSSQAYPSCKLYSTKFIIDCAYNDVIIDPSPYRIGMRMLYDDCVMHHFLHGRSSCCPPETTNIVVKSEPLDPIEEEQNTSEMESDQNVARGSKENSSEELSSEKETDVPLPNITSDESSETDFDESDEIGNGQRKCSLQSKKTNGSVSRRTRNEISDTNHVPKQSIAGISSHKRSNWNFIPDSDDEESNVSEDHRNHEDDESEEESTMTDDTSEELRSEKMACGPKFTSMDDKAIVKFLVVNRVIGEVGTGLLVWKKLIESGFCKNHTPDSLHKHFYANILPKIRKYKLTKSQLKRFDRLVV